MIKKEFPIAYPHYQQYAERILQQGRHWLGANAVCQIEPIEITCGNYLFHFAPHQYIQEGSNRLVFRMFTYSPIVEFSQQYKLMRWIARHLKGIYSDHSVSLQLADLNTGEIKEIPPYYKIDKVRLPTLANQLISGDFSPTSKSKTCLRCRHFTYCPA